MEIDADGKTLLRIEDADIKYGKIVIPESVEEISENFVCDVTKKFGRLVLTNIQTVPHEAFVGLLMEEVVAPELKEISYSAFLNCAELVKVSSPNLYAIGDDAFKGCTKLAHIDLLNIRVLGDAFEFSEVLQVFKNRAYSKIGFTPKQSNYAILERARKLRIKKGLESEVDKFRNASKNVCSPDFVMKNPNFAVNENSSINNNL